MFRFVAIFLVALGLCGCDKIKHEPPAPPQIVVTELENKVYQFQYDNGQDVDMASFTLFLDAWLKEKPDVSVISLIPQVINRTDHNGRSYSTVNGVLVFTRPTGVVPPDTPQKPMEEQKPETP